MIEYKEKLVAVAGFMGVSPEILHRYLFQELEPVKEALLINPKLIQLEQSMIYDAAGVQYVLIEKRERLAPQPRTISTYSEMLAAVYKGAAERDYSSLYFVSHGDLATDDYFQAVLTKHPNAGVLLLIPQRADTLAEVCMELGHLCLVIDYVPKEIMPIHVLNVDNFGAELEITRNLIALGHRRIAFITGMLEYASAADRFDGYRAALEEADIPCDPDLIGNGDWGMKRGKELTQAFLALDTPPTAVVCSNDLTALGAYEAILQQGLVIPDDISVVGFDDIPMALEVNPPLSTVRQSLGDMGNLAVNLLIDAMEGSPAVDGFEHKYPLELQMRQSTGHARI